MEEWEGCRVYVWKEKFAIVKSKKTHPDAFANVVDKKEITVIVDQTKYDKANAIEAEEGYRMLTFDTTLPFNLVGFIAKVSKALAEEGIPIFVVSSFSTDHILVKEKYLKKTKKALERLGFKVEEEPR